MTTFFYVQEGVQKGPYSLEELKQHKIQPNTLVWRAGLQNWLPAKDLEDLSSLFWQTPPPPTIHQAADILPISSTEANVQNTTYDYSNVEDKAGVDYKQATYITGVLLLFNVVSVYLPFNPIGIIILTGLAIAAWYYFKAYFDAYDDVVTAKWITVIMSANGVLCLTYLYAWSIDWQLLVGASIFQGGYNLLMGGGQNTYYQGLVSSVDLIKYMLIGAALANFVAGFRLISINRNYPFPLKRIAVSSMLLLPLLFISYFIEGMMEGVQTNPIIRILLGLPYLFLLHHFYRADTEDATP
jgi:hypothetical protein